MTDIFVSHAVADKVLADKFVAFLKEAIGVPSKSIFCTSVDGQGVPLGKDFSEYMKNKIQNPELVILLMTPRYMESSFCLMELGAAWAKSLNSLPIVVPPITFSAISGTLGLTQGWNIEDDIKLIDLRELIQSTKIKLEHRTAHDWEKKRAVWKADLKKILKEVEPAANVSAAEHKSLKDKQGSLEQELASLQEAYSEASATIEALKAAKDPAAVKAIMAKTTGLDAEAEFDELIATIAALQPKVSTEFYRNMILDRFGKSASLQWGDLDQKADAESAIQYNIMESDPPHGLLWSNKKLHNIAVAVQNLEDFLQSEEAIEFVAGREKEGASMDLDDLQFWEENL